MNKRDYIAIAGGLIVLILLGLALFAWKEAAVDKARAEAKSELSLSETPKYLSRRELYSFPNSSLDADSFPRTLLRASFHHPFTP